MDTLYDAAIAGDANAKAELAEEANRVDVKQYTILHTESENGNIERVRFILKEFANENLLAKITIYKHTALHLAIYSGYTEVAEVLIDAARQHMSVSSFQAFLRQGDKDKDTALHAAVMEENVDIVKLLVEADRTDRHTQNDEGKTPMYIAVEKGFNEIAEIISTTCTAPSFDGPYGSTVVRINDLDQDESPGGTLYKIIDADTMFDAAIAGDADAIAKLELEADKVNYYEETILHVLSDIGEAEYVRFILTKFANKNLLVKVNTYKQTALHLAASNGHTEAAKVLIDEARLLPPSAIDNPITSFQAFLRQGDENKDTALHLAVESGVVAVVKLLVGADRDDRHIQNNHGETPLYTAAKKGQFEIVKAICTTCTAPSLEGPERSTALHAFISNIHEANEENKDVTIKLIDAAKKWSSTEEGKNQWLEAFFNRTDEDGLCLLELAAGKNDRGVVKLLLENDPAYRRRNKKNSVMRSIFISVQKEYSDMVKLLTEAYEEAGKTGVHKGTADGLLRKPKETGEGGKVAVHKGVVSFIVAIKKHDKDEIIDQLKDDRLVLKFTEDEGWTPLHYAAYHKFDFILELFIEAQKQLGHPFSYGDNKPTPFHVAAENKSTSTVEELMRLWPPQSSSTLAAVNKVGRNILHIAAAASNKEMIQYILRYIGKLAYYLGLEVNQQDGFIEIKQTAYGRRILEKMNMVMSRPVRFPMESKVKIDKDEGGELVDSTLYRSVIGELRYLVHTRPDISYSVGVLSRYMEKPTRLHYNAVKRVLRYIKGTLDYGLVYHQGSGNYILSGYSDSDHAGSIDDRKSTTGILFYLNENLITWVSQKQRCVALSSCEAEFMAVTAAATQGIWLQNLMKQVVDVSPGPVVIYVDNKSAIDLTRNPIINGRSKHIDMRFHFIRDCVERGEIVVKYVATQEQRADILTKPLTAGKFEEMRMLLGVKNLVNQV